MLPTRSTAAVSSLLVAGLLTACGGGSSTPSTVASAASDAAPATAVDPNAPEVNEPGDIPDNQVFVAYVAPDGTYKLKVPEGWARSETDGVTTFTDKLNSISVESHPAGAAPTVAAAQANEVVTLAARPGYAAGDVSQVHRAGGDAILITYQADAEPDPVTGKVVHDDVERYEFWRNGTSTVLTLAGPTGADNVDPWRLVTDSFRWTG